MMQAVCDKLGYELKIDDMAFDSIISAVQSGKADVGVAGMTVTPDREKNVLFSDTYTSSSTGNNRKKEIIFHTSLS